MPQFYCILFIKIPFYTEEFPFALVPYRNKHYITNFIGANFVREKYELILFSERTVPYPFSHWLLPVMLIRIQSDPYHFDLPDPDPSSKNSAKIMGNSNKKYHFQNMLILKISLVFVNPLSCPVLSCPVLSCPVLSPCYLSPRSQVYPPPTQPGIFCPGHTRP